MKEVFIVHLQWQCMDFVSGKRCLWIVPLILGFAGHLVPRAGAPLSSCTCSLGGLSHTLQLCPSLTLPKVTVTQRIKGEETMNQYILHMCSSMPTGLPPGFPLLCLLTPFRS